MDDGSLLLADVAAWRAWLDVNENASDGVWLVMAKSRTVVPTSLTYAQALDEALCSGWIDGQRRKRDGTTFLQRFTPRRARSIWSQRNVGLVEALIAQGRMRSRGRAEIERARLDGRWARAYPGSSAMDVPEDVATALAASPIATERFAELDSGRRYALLLPIITAPPELRGRRVAAMIRRLEVPDPSPSR